jgi:hexosaminidase
LRIEIRSWPRLATHGGSTQVGGGPGGYYTQQQYRELVAYAAARHVTIIPEIDMPGHTTAALASYAELNCDGVAPPLFIRTGNAIGFSSLCTDREITYRFVDDVLREVAELTPGEYLHIGTDETHATRRRAFSGSSPGYCRSWPGTASRSSAGTSFSRRTRRPRPWRSTGEGTPPTRS